ncbi:MAG: hypothetical protein QOG74_2505, partial [Alphaproteobacteria bacterium]|nr:hypothetical protein [Alphaproteobacteria bacterium]
MACHPAGPPETSVTETVADILRAHR